MNQRAQLLIMLLFTTAISVTPLTSVAKAKKSQKSELSTNVEFDPMTVHGRYQFAAEGRAQVEDEKVLYDLLGPRKNFKDRMKQMARQK